MNAVSWEDVGDGLAARGPAVGTAVAVLGYVVVWLYQGGGPGEPNQDAVQAGLIAVGFLALLSTSGTATTVVLELIGEVPEGEGEDGNEGQGGPDGAREDPVATENGDDRDGASGSDGGGSSGGDDAAAAKPDKDVGMVVGKAENVLILTFVLVAAYDAIALVFAAKSIIRGEDFRGKNTRYYLGGTLTNVTYSVVFGILLQGLLALHGVSGVELLVSN